VAAFLLTVLVPPPPPNKLKVPDPFCGCFLGTTLVAAGAAGAGGGVAGFLGALKKLNAGGGDAFFGSGFG